MDELSVIRTSVSSEIKASSEASVRIDPEREAELRAAAADFEAVFVRQMLDNAGLAEAFGAGEGQSSEAFSSFLLDQLASDLAQKGSFGLAERFYENLAAREGLAEETEGRRV